MTLSRLSTLLRLAPVCILAAVLASCATAPEPAGPGNWQQHRAALTALSRWQLEAKLGYRSPQQSGSAWINWQQQDEHFNLNLHGPLGAGATRIQGDESHATLTQSGETTIAASSAAELTQQTLGTPLPIQQLTQWVKGIPADKPRPQQLTFDPSGQLVVLEQAGWALNYSRFQSVEGYLLPGRIQGKNGDITFTLVIKQWRLPNGAAP